MALEWWSFRAKSEEETEGSFLSKKREWGEKVSSVDCFFPLSIRRLQASPSWLWQFSWILLRLTQDLVHWNYTKKCFPSFSRSPLSSGWCTLFPSSFICSFLISSLSQTLHRHLCERGLLCIFPFWIHNLFSTRPCLHLLFSSHSLFLTLFLISAEY